MGQFFDSYVCKTGEQFCKQQHRRNLKTPTAAVLAVIFTLLTTQEAKANGPQFVAALSGKAADEWQANCATATQTGAPCSATICGANVSIEPGIPGAPRNLTVNGTSYNLHDPTPANGVDLAAAALLNALCSTGGGDPFVATAGSFAVQAAQAESFIARGETGFGFHTTEMPSVSGLTVGGAYERGASSTNGFVLPVAYGRNLSESRFFSVGGSLMYGSRGGGGTQPDGRSVPGLTQYGISINPSYGMDMRKGKSIYTVGGYLPIAYSKASFGQAEQSFSAYAIGIGGIGTVTTTVGNMAVSGGLAAAGRKTGGAFALPITAVVRAARPLSAMVEGHGSLSYGNDPVGAKTGMFTVSAGVASGKTELGLRGFFAGNYTAVMIGFSYRMELEGQAAIERPQADPSKEPEKKPPEAKKPTKP